MHTEADGPGGGGLLGISIKRHDCVLAVHAESQHPIIGCPCGMEDHFPGTGILRRDGKLDVIPDLRGPDEQLGIPAPAIANPRQLLRGRIQSGGAVHDLHGFALLCPGKPDWRPFGVPKPFGKPRQFREWRVRLGLIPVGHRGDVVRELLVFSIPSPAQGLNRHPQILFKIDRVLNVPAVKAPEVRRLRPLGCRKNCPGVGGGVWLLESVAAQEIVLRSGAANGGKLAIPIHVELDLPLPEPAFLHLGPGKEGSHIASPALHPVQNDIRIPVRS